MLLTQEDAFCAETEERRVRGIVSPTDGWGSAAVMTHGGDLAYRRMARSIEAWTRQGRLGLEALRLAAVLAAAAMVPGRGTYRLPRPFFDLIASHDVNG